MEREWNEASGTSLSPDRIPPLTKVEANQQGYRWVAITAMLYAIGIILHTVSPNVGGVTINWTIAMYCIVINLTKPPLTRAIGMGFIAGITLIPSSKSAFPLGNLASEICGATTCCLLLKALAMARLGDWKLAPLVTGFCSTFVSGGVFTFILRLILNLPLGVWLKVMLPVVAVVGVLNAVVTFGLYGPVKKLFFAREGGRTA
ncbi:MAG: ABC transporter [Succiniclasticum sp.]|nr:ABC transporter [Succiniclasticum sp.]MCI6223247.1 ABC transporter [Selenomonadales bacterium]MDY2869576.1 ABC transporter [Succiniclasticum sp.]MDY6304289.1 ABC transporter [Succiniclasticum sp.]MDY6345808.1 ABC transporter [Succiniclasticum sp.]